MLAKLLESIKQISFPTAFLSYAVVGLSACNYFSLLRGNIFESKISLVAFRTFFFSLVWLPVQRLSPICGLILLPYLPMFADLSEYHFGTGISSWVKLNFVTRFLKSKFNIKLVKTCDITDKQCIIG